MDVRLPDGSVIAGVPDGTTKADLVARLQRNGMAVPADWLAAAPTKPAAEQLGDTLRQVPRQLGLAARYGIKGVLGLPGMVVDAGTGAYNAAADAVAGPGVGARIPQAQAALDSALTRLGLPEPQGADERVVGDATSMVAGAGGMIKAADKAAQLASGATKDVLARFAARPGMQLAGAGASGGAGGAVREAGGSPLEQFGASLLGGIGGGLAAGKAAGAGQAALRALTPRGVQMQQAEQQISLTLQRSGIDWSAVPERLKQGLREDVAAALSQGQPLNAEALRRLLVFRRARLTPTVGQLTQDPGQITREANLAKAGANSTDPALQRLPALQNENVRALLGQLDEAGAANAPSAADASRGVINALGGNIAAARGEINALYNGARDTAGRSLPLEGGIFTRRASELIDEAMAGDSLPKAVENRLNAIARGEYPLTVESAEALKTRIGRLQRGNSDGTARHALGLVRQALDETPLQGAPTVNPGQLPALPGTVPASPTQIGKESINAFNAARGANRTFMQRLENNPALQAVADGVEPDQFMQRYVIGKGASAADVRALRDELSPEALQQLRSHLVRHLKDAATNSTDDVAKFSNAAYRKALRDLEDKLPAFFSDEEIQRLRDLGDAAKYMQAQPAGSAVNNSNSGALLIGKGLDLLERAAGYVPLGGRDIIRGSIQGLQQRQVLAPRNALALAAPRPAPPRLNPLLAAAAAAPAQAREDDRSK
jgi:hypothetical protein